MDQNLLANLCWWLLQPALEVNTQTKNIGKKMRNKTINEAIEQTLQIFVKFDEIKLLQYTMRGVDINLIVQLSINLCNSIMF